MATGFTAEEYATMGEGYSNFSSEDEALAKIPVFLLEKFRYLWKNGLETLSQSCINYM